MLVRYHLGIVDYIVIFISLLISAGIGVILKYYGRSSKSTADYLLAGKNMSKIPVIFSIVVTMTSPVALLSIPFELYKYGFNVLLFYVGMPVGMFLAAFVTIPVYFQCGVTTVTEFLLLRFGKWTQSVVSIALFIHMLAYMSVTLYGAVLAFSTVTDLSIEMSIIALGLVCTFYCCIGGLKAVLWTDVYQFLLMFSCLVIIYVTGIQDGGGISTIIERLYEGKRIDSIDFEFEFLKRYTFWNCLAKGAMYGFSMYGTNQLEVQRVLSLNNVNKAKVTIVMSSLPVAATFLLCTLPGAIFYSIYYRCDPILNKAQTGISKYDQILPYYIITRFNSIPGMTGLCIAGIFSACLSTVSSALNSLTTLTVVDFIKPIVERRGRMSDSKTVFIAKSLSILYGGICIAMSFSFLGLSSLIVISASFFNATEGAILLVFLCGVLTRKGPDKVISVCFVTTIVLMFCLTLGSMYSGYNPPHLPLSTDMCAPSANASTNLSGLVKLHDGTIESTQIITQASKSDIFILYKTSYFWHSFFGFLLSAILVTLGISITGWSQNVIPADSDCLSPVTRLWIQDNSLKKEKSEKDSDASASTKL